MASSSGFGSHRHHGGCYTTKQTCTLDPHHHTGSCFDKDQQLKCGKPLHAHTSSCYGQVKICPQP